MAFRSFDSHFVITLLNFPNVNSFVSYARLHWAYEEFVGDSQSMMIQNMLFGLLGAFVMFLHVPPLCAASNI